MKLSRRVAILASRVRSRLVFISLDVVFVVGAYGAAEVLYYRDSAPAHYWQDFTSFVVVAVVVTLVANQVFGLYGRMWRHAGAEEARSLLLSTGASVAALLLFYPIGRLVGVQLVPVPVVLLGGVFVLLGMGALRFHSRLFAWQRGVRRVGLRVAVVGSHGTGASAIREMLRCPEAGLVPVAVFDDDPKTHGLSLLGVPVVGGIGDLPAVAERFEVQQVLLAIPSATPDLVARVLRVAETAGVTMKVLPTVHDIVGRPAHLVPVREAREPRIEDLLGRAPVDTDLDAVRRALAGRRILVTGAGGSIGSEICRQLALLRPEALVLLDHDETHLHDAAAVIPFPCQQALVDVTDAAAVRDAFLRFRPEVVFHAAAHKHVPVLEQYPVEAVKTNVLGTLHVVEAAAATGVERFVLISTDKAVRPSSVMGATKHVAERIVLDRSPQGAAYCAVRFGNVLGSRGSVIPTFARQIRQGGPVTVTDERMTRFFMSVEEAVQLVLQASVLADGGEIFMLEMGEPVRIVDLARRMIRLSGLREGEDIAIEVVGRRPGEKLEEELRTPEEQVLRTEHPSIYRLVPILADRREFDGALGDLLNAAQRRDDAAVRTSLFERVVEPSPAVGEPAVPAGPRHVPA